MSSVDSVCEWKQEIKPKLLLSASALMQLKLLYFSTVWFRCGWAHISSFLQRRPSEYSIKWACLPAFCYLKFKAASESPSTMRHHVGWWILWSSGLHIKGPQWLQRARFPSDWNHTKAFGPFLDIQPWNSSHLFCLSLLSFSLMLESLGSTSQLRI